MGSEYGGDLQADQDECLQRHVQITETVGMKFGKWSGGISIGACLAKSVLSQDVLLGPFYRVAGQPTS